MKKASIVMVGFCRCSLVDTLNLHACVCVCVCLFPSSLLSVSCRFHIGFAAVMRCVNVSEIAVGPVGVSMQSGSPPLSVELPRDLTHTLPEEDGRAAAHSRVSQNTTRDTKLSQA